MEENAFSAPQAELIDDSNNEISGISREFYIVSTTKFLVLYITSLGIYSLYWFYKHWQQY